MDHTVTATPRADVLHRAVEFAVGLLFGLGLIVSGMTDPGKVQGFLDLLGAWDPSLAFVMGGAIGVGLIAFGRAKKQTATLLGLKLGLPGRRDIDARLIVGSLAFGVGWGLAGFCPGPALVSLGAGHWQAALFVGAMVLGMGGFELIERARQQRAAALQGVDG